MPFTRKGVTLGSVLRGIDPRVRDAAPADDDVEDDSTDTTAPETEPASATDLDDARHDANVVPEQTSTDDTTTPPAEPAKPAPVKAPAKKAPAKAAFRSALDAKKG